MRFCFSTLFGATVCGYRSSWAHFKTGCGQLLGFIQVFETYTSVPFVFHNHTLSLYVRRNFWGWVFWVLCVCLMLLYVFPRTFAPMWDVFRVSSDKLALCHLELMRKMNDLIREINKYGDEQVKIHRKVCTQAGGCLMMYHYPERKWAD